jgi:hypothetical protein
LNDPVKGIDPFCRPTFLRLLQTLERCFYPHFATQNGIQMEHVIQIFGNILFPKEGIHRHRGDTGITTTGTGTYTGNKKKFFFIEILLKNHFFLCEPMRLTFQRKTQLLVNKLQRIQQFKSQLNPYNTHTFVPQQSFVVEQELKILFKNLSSILINSKFSTAKKTWKHVGFYFDNDPFKELQGGGLLVIYALQFFVTKYPQRVAQMLQKRLEYTRNDYPFPNTSVHILRMVLQVLGILDVTIGTDILLNKKVELWPERWLQHCDQFTTCLSMEKSVDTLSSSSIDTSSCEGMFFVSSSESKWQFMEEETALYELFCMSMFLFDHFWTQSNANWMDFTFVLEKTKNQLENMFQFIAKTTNANNTTCLPDMLWTITEESLK